MSIGKFGEITSKLARNPLSIIALFIFLIYGIACLTFSYNKNLSQGIIWVFVAFIILYPIIVLAVFYLLVTKHHTKLYAPADFPRPENFIECFYGDERQAITRRESETKKPQEGGSATSSGITGQ